MELKSAISSIEKPNIDEIYFISDLHIRTPSEKTFNDLVNLISCVSPTTLMVFGGDIFHVFVGGSTFFEKKFHKFFEALKKISGRWIYLAGNHDFHHDSIIHRYGGLYFDHPVVVSLEKSKFFFAHGDEVDEEDVNYHKLRKFFHSSFSKFVIQAAPGFLIELVGNFLGSLSKDSRAKKKKLHDESVKQRQIEIFKNYVKKVGLAHQVSGVFLGHNHILANEKIQEGLFLLNPGRKGEWHQNESFFIQWKDARFTTLPLSDIRLT